MMRLSRFRALTPQSLSEAAAALADLGAEASVLAGGTDLLPNMKWRCAESRRCARAPAILRAA